MANNSTWISFRCASHHLCRNLLKPIWQYTCSTCCMRKWNVCRWYTFLPLPNCMQLLFLWSVPRMVQEPLQTHWYVRLEQPLHTLYISGSHSETKNCPERMLCHFAVWDFRSIQVTISKTLLVVMRGTFTECHYTFSMVDRISIFNWQLNSNSEPIFLPLLIKQWTNEQTM